MKFLAGSICILMAAAGATTLKAEPRGLFEAFDYADVGRLKELAASDADSDMRALANVMLLTAYGKDDAALAADRELKLDTQPSYIRCVALLNRASIYARQDKYSDARNVILSAIDVDPECVGEGIRDSLALFNKLSDVPPMAIIGPGTGRLAIKRDPNHLPATHISVNSHPVEATLDTGASYSVIDLETARHAGLSVFKVADTQGAETTEEFAVAESITLGETTLKNVVFKVVSGEGVMRGEDGHVTHAILGLPVFEKLGRLDFIHTDQEDFVTFGHQPGEKTGDANLIHNWTVVYVVAQDVDRGHEMRLLLDTGSQNSFLTKTALDDFPELAEGAPVIQERYQRITGQTEDKGAFLIPGLNLSVAQSVVRFRDIVLFPSWTNVGYHGVLGQGAYLSASHVIIDLDRMYFDMVR